MRGGRSPRKGRQMKRDPDLERQILLAIEANDPQTGSDIDLSSFESHSDRQLSYQVMLLHEAGLIKAHEIPDESDAPLWWMPERLTMAGHEYLDSIRDEEAWRRTKEGALAVGSFSLEALGALARALVREKIRKHTGLEVDL